MNVTLHAYPTRALTAWTPFYRPLGLLDEIDELAREFWTSWRPSIFSTTLSPHVDMYEEKGQLVIKAELPGIDEKDLEVTLDGDMLTIKAEKKEELTEDAAHHIHGRYFGTYVQSMTLPCHINGDNVSATFENGVLELRFPKAEQSKAKRIEVKAELPQAKPKQRQRKSRQKSN